MGSPKACLSYDYATILKNMHYEIELMFPYYRTDPTARKDWAKLLKRFSCEGLGFLTLTLPALGKCMIQSFNDGYFTCPCAFKKQKGWATPMIYHGLFSKIYNPDGTIRDDANVHAMRLLNQLCFMFYKLELPFRDTQTEAAMDKYYEAERSCKSLTLYESDSLLNAARDIVTDIFKDFNPMDIKPNISNGVLATGEVGVEKFIPTRKYENIHRVYPYYEYFETTLNALGDSLRGNTAELLHAYKRLIPEKSGCSKMCAVPKNADGPRFISMEPAEYMYMQQGLKHVLCNHLEQITSNQINFIDQSYNQKAALYASTNGVYDTYDFSSCSDRNSLILVESLFRDVPKLLNCLIALRTTHTITPDGEKIRLYKYAPMGSALCFPVMATCIYAIAKAHNKSLKVLVYGDDLIVESDSSYKDLPANFARLGLKINNKKSFTRGLFRESCGCDAYNGYIITPIRIKKDIACKTPESFAALVDTSNVFYNAGYWHLAGCLRKIIQKNASLEVPTSSVHQNIDGLTFCFATDATDNIRIVFKKSRLFYQRRVLSLDVPKITQSLSGDYGYRMALLSRGGTERKPSELLIRDTTKKSRLISKWKDMYCTCDQRFIAA